jgi:hypothetical protein
MDRDVIQHSDSTDVIVWGFGRYSAIVQVAVGQKQKVKGKDK